MTLHLLRNGNQESARVDTVSSLLVVLPGRDGSAAVAPATVLFGLPLVHRIVLSAERAGFERVVVLATDEDAVKTRALLDGTLALVASPDHAGPDLAARRIVVLAGDILPDRKWLAALRERPVSAGAVDCDPMRAAVIEITPDSHALPATMGTGRYSLAALATLFKAKTCDLDDRGCFVIEPSVTVAQAEDWLLAGLVKETDGFMASLVARPISLAITRRLVATPFSANAMTVLSTLIGLAGAPFFLSSIPGVQFIGAMLFVTHSILDGCDGEMARLRFTESRMGGLLDFWGDNLVHVAVFSCMAIGWSLDVGTAWPLLVGCGAVLGTIGSAGFVHWRTMRRIVRPKNIAGPVFTSVAQSPGSDISRILDGLARRDFIYLVMALSAFGKAAWFLVLAAAGAPIFFFLLMWVAYSETRLKAKECYE